VIKLELDVDPPSDYKTEIRQGIMPYPHTVRMYDLPTMHACKLHAILCRNWRNRVKGRDYYDVLYYASKGVGVNTSHLVKRLEQSGIEVTDREEIRTMLKERFKNTDYTDAISDVKPFVIDKNRLRNWSPDLFVSIADGLEFI
jgi:predicted nucleotidyltransferase component of viral defense system